MENKHKYLSEEAWNVALGAHRHEQYTNKRGDTLIKEIRMSSDETTKEGDKVFKITAIVNTVAFQELILEYLASEMLRMVESETNKDRV